MPDSQDKEDIPPMVTFTSGAELLVRLGVVPNMTREGVRKIANTDPQWPFGPEREHQYKKIANAQAMDTVPFLAFFRARKTRGRGPARPKPATEQPPVRRIPHHLEKGQADG